MRTLALVLLLLTTRTLTAQVSDSSRGGGRTVSGVVIDSLTNAPLAGALVQLAPADSGSRFGTSVTADSGGRYLIAGVPDGTYLLGFYHPLLDSLLVEPPVHRIVVAGQSLIQHLAVPSPAQLRAAICPARTPSGGAALAGVIRDASDLSPRSGVSVTAEWLELSIARGTVGRRVARLVATTGENGWFALCDIPKGGSISLLATRGADSTDPVHILVPASGFSRGDLYLGLRTRGSDSVSVRGTVVKADGKPLAGAQVTMARRYATANERGEWQLERVPSGTRMLEVRAVGFYPERRSVHVISGAAPVRVSLSTLTAVLDTMRVTATRARDVDLDGFRKRMKSSGFGHFLTPEDIARRNAIVTSDLLRTVPGLRIDEPKGSAQQSGITMRGLWARWPGGTSRCAPLIYLDGMYMGVADSTLSPDDIDNWIRPTDIGGLEVYTQQEVPPQFSRGMAAECGSIVIWSKPRLRRDGQSPTALTPPTPPPPAGAPPSPRTRALSSKRRTSAPPFLHPYSG